VRFAKPRHSSTGKRGYFGSSGCLHMEKVDPRVLRTIF
jgi:hypothetical protein